MCLLVSRKLRIEWLRHDVSQRPHDEGPFVHSRMRYLQVGLVDADVVVEQDVNVYCAVVVDAVHRLHGSPHLTLYLLRDGKQLSRSEWRRTAERSIHEPVVREESDRL